MIGDVVVQHQETRNPPLGLPFQLFLGGADLQANPTTGLISVRLYYSSLDVLLVLVVLSCRVELLYLDRHVVTAHLDPIVSRGLAFHARDRLTTESMLLAESLE